MADTEYLLPSCFNNLYLVTWLAIVYCKIWRHSNNESTLWVHIYTEFLHLTHSLGWHHKISSSRFQQHQNLVLFLCAQKWNHRGWELQLTIQNVSTAYQTVPTCVFGRYQNIGIYRLLHMVDICENVSNLVLLACWVIIRSTSHI